MIAGTVSADPEHPLTQIIGDGLVTRSSATGEAREARKYNVLPDATIRVFPRSRMLRWPAAPRSTRRSTRCGSRHQGHDRR